jgi:hypothetical protein
MFASVGGVKCHATNLQLIPNRSPASNLKNRWHLRPLGAGINRKPLAATP